MEQQKMTDEEIEALVKKTAEETAEEVLRRAFISMGLDMTTPSGIVAAQADMQHLRAWRTSVETVKRQGLLTAVIILTTGLLGLVWTAIRYGNTPTAP